MNHHRIEIGPSSSKWMSAPLSAPREMNWGPREPRWRLTIEVKHTNINSITSLCTQEKHAGYFIDWIFFCQRMQIKISQHQRRKHRICSKQKEVFHTHALAPAIRVLARLFWGSTRHGIYYFLTIYCTKDQILYKNQEAKYAKWTLIVTA
jgi:hypothetical protein